MAWEGTGGGAIARATIRREEKQQVPSLLLSSLELIDTKAYEPQIRALLGTASQFCKVVVQGYLAHQKLPLSYDHRRVLGTSLL